MRTRVIAAGLLALTVPGAASEGRGEGRAAMSTPYDIAARIWRDEQPGAEPRLHLAATLVPRPGARAWSEMALASVRLRAGAQTWTPEQSSLEPRADGSFEVRARGAATVAAGATVVPVIELTTSTGSKELLLPPSAVQQVR